MIDEKTLVRIRTMAEGYHESRVHRYPALLNRFRVQVVNTRWMLVTDLTMIGDFCLEPGAMEREFGLPLDVPSLYLWEVLWMLAEEGSR